MLLTSSQVSIAISSAIVVVFTLALFLSGYAIQQRTLRDLRAAIKPPPRPSPKVFLPDRFRKSTTELPDGTIVTVDDDADYGRPARGSGGRRRQQQRQQQQGAVVEVKPTVRDQEQKVVAGGGGDAKRGKKKAQREPSPRKEKTRAPAKGTPQEGGDEDGDLVPNPNGESQKPVSRAERRRLIKEEIQRLSQGERQVYYQRRLW